MSKTKKEIIIDFARKASATIVGNASVSDNWINQIKTYKKIELTDGDTALIWIWTIGMFNVSSTHFLKTSFYDFSSNCLA